MKIVFFGSSKYSTIVQKALNSKFGLVLSVSAPDKPKGRQRKLTPTPVKEFALKIKIDVIAPAKLDKAAIENIAKYKPDFLVVSDYGLILPPKLLKLPKYDVGQRPPPRQFLQAKKNQGLRLFRCPKMSTPAIFYPKKNIP